MSKLCILDCIELISINLYFYTYIFILYDFEFKDLFKSFKMIIILEKKTVFKMSNFDLEKMARTVDNLSTCLDLMLCCKDTEGGEDILNNWEQLDKLITSFDDQMNILKESLIKEENARQSVSQLI